MCSADNFLSPIFSPYLWSLKHVTSGSVEQVLSKESYFMFLCTFLTFCCCFLSKKLCFYHFHCFFFEVSNFRSRILTNQESELVIRNCQWHCMLSGTILILFLIFWWLRRAQGISTHCKALQLGCQVSSDLTCFFRALEFLEEFSDFEDFI